MFIWAGLLLHTSQQWTLVCGGDIMLNALSPTPKRLQSLSRFFTNADVGMANLEIPLTNSKTPTRRKSAAEVKARTQFILKANPKHAEYFPSWGFKLLTQGNNHAMDYGVKGITEMLQVLDKRDIAHTGVGDDRDEAWTPARVDLPGGQKLSVGAALAFASDGGLYKCTPATDDSPGVATLTFNGNFGEDTRETLRELVDSLRKDDGPVILFLHWGVERKSIPEPYQVKLGRMCVDAGADAVIGSHPHVLQGAENYRGHPIVYSLGNLISPTPCESSLVELWFSGRTFKAYAFHPFAVRAGVAKAYAGKDRVAAIKRIHDLSSALVKKYPSKFSKPF